LPHRTRRRSRPVCWWSTLLVAFFATSVACALSPRQEIRVLQGLLDRGYFDLFDSFAKTRRLSPATAKALPMLRTQASIARIRPGADPAAVARTFQAAQATLKPLTGEESVPFSPGLLNRLRTTAATLYARAKTLAATGNAQQRAAAPAFFHIAAEMFHSVRLIGDNMLDGDIPEKEVVKLDEEILHGDLFSPWARYDLWRHYPPSGNKALGLTLPAKQECLQKARELFVECMFNWEGRHDGAVVDATRGFLMACIALNDLSDVEDACERVKIPNKALNAWGRKQKQLLTVQVARVRARQEKFPEAMTLLQAVVARQPATGRSTIRSEALVGLAETAKLRAAKLKKDKAKPVEVAKAAQQAADHLAEAARRSDDREAPLSQLLALETELRAIHPQVRSNVRESRRRAGADAAYRRGILLYKDKKYAEASAPLAQAMQSALAQRPADRAMAARAANARAYCAHNLKDSLRAMVLFRYAHALTDDEKTSTGMLGNATTMLWDIYLKSGRRYQADRDILIELCAALEPRARAAGNQAVVDRARYWSFSAYYDAENLEKTLKTFAAISTDSRYYENAAARTGNLLARRYKTLKGQKGLKDPAVIEGLRQAIRVLEPAVAKARAANAAEKRPKEKARRGRQIAVLSVSLAELCTEETARRYEDALKVLAPLDALSKAAGQRLMSAARYFRVKALARSGKFDEAARAVASMRVQYEAAKAGLSKEDAKAAKRNVGNAFLELSNAHEQAAKALAQKDAAAARRHEDKVTEFRGKYSEFMGALVTLQYGLALQEFDRGNYAAARKYLLNLKDAIDKRWPVIVKELKTEKDAKGFKLVVGRYLLDCSIRLKDSAAAAKLATEFETVWKVTPQDSLGLWMLMADAHHKAGQFPAARQKWGRLKDMTARSAERKPIHVRAVYGFALAYAAEKKPKDAYMHLAYTATLAPDLGGALTERQFPGLIKKYRALMAACHKAAGITTPLPTPPAPLRIRPKVPAAPRTSPRTPAKAETRTTKRPGTKAAPKRGPGTTPKAGAKAPAKTAPKASPKPAVKAPPKAATAKPAPKPSATGKARAGTTQ
jgi:hypothetical protein